MFALGVNALSKGGISQPTGGTWTPADMVKRAWYDASSDSYLSVTSGGNVTNVRDRSGNGFDLSSLTTGRPARVIGALNGLNVINFSGSQISRKNTSSNVFKNIGSGLLVALRKITNRSSLGYVFSISKNSDASPRAALIIGASGNKNSMIGRRLDSDSVKNIHSTDNGSSDWEIHIGVYDWANSNAYLYINGALQGSDTNFQTDGNTSNTNANEIMIGGNKNSGYITGQFAEALIVESDITSATRQRIEGYLAHKWGLTSLLENGHPYKNFSP